MKKKWLMLTLSSVLAIGLLVGCGAGKEADNEQDVIQQPDLQTPSADDVPTGTPEGEMDEQSEEPADADIEEPADAGVEEPADAEVESPADTDLEVQTDQEKEAK